MKHFTKKQEEAFRKSKLMCPTCMPPAPLEGHLEMYGKPLHARTDMPENLMYFFNEKDLRLREDST